jgi:nucleoside 2-deoxyribosyltransferase
MVRKLKCYISQAITLLIQHEKKSVVKKYKKIYDFIEQFLEKEHGVEVFNPIKHESGIRPSDIYWRDIRALSRANFVVAEVSVVSWGVGVELMYAIMKGKPILALYNANSKYKLSEMVSGSGMRLRKYNDKNGKTMLSKHISEFIKEYKQYAKLKRGLTSYQL